MARIERQSSQLVIVADSDEERALIHHGQQRGGWLVLLGASYPTGEIAERLYVGLPKGASLAVAARVQPAFEKAAQAHAAAAQRRQRFRLVD